jgi:hypothetical protein
MCFSLRSRASLAPERGVRMERAAAVCHFPERVQSVKWCGGAVILLKPWGFVC